MSEYFVGKGRHGAEPMEPPLPGEEGTTGPAGGRRRGRHVADPVPEHVRFGLPFNGVVPLWHDDAEITWHRPLDGTDLSDLLGLGFVEAEPGSSQAPSGWSEWVESGVLVPAGWAQDDVAASLDPDEGPVLRLRAADPVGRRAINDPGDGAAIRLGPQISFDEAMEGGTAGFDLTGFSVHVARLMLRAARDGAILIFTLRAPRDPEPHHLLSIPSQVDEQQVMHFHLGTLLEMEDGPWGRATHAQGMAMLDMHVPYTDLVGAATLSEGEHVLDVDRLVEMARPAVDVLLKPGFPFALGCSVVLPDTSGSGTTD